MCVLVIAQQLLLDLEMIESSVFAHFISAFLTLRCHFMSIYSKEKTVTECVAVRRQIINQLS